MVALVLMWLYLKDPRNVVSAAKQPIDLIGILTLTIGLGCLQLMLDKGETEGWMDSSFIRRLLILCIIGLVAFVIRELTTRYPVVNLRVLKNRGLAAGSSSTFVVGVCMMSYLMLLPVFLQNMRQYTALQTGIVVLPFAIACGIMMPVSAIINAHMSARPIVALGAISAFIGVYMTSKVTLLTGFEHLLWGQILFGIGVSACMLPLMTASLSGLRGRDLAEGSAIFNLSRTLGGSIGIAYVTARLNQATVFSRNIIGEHVTIYDPEVLSRLMQYKQFFMSKGASSDVASQQALHTMDMVIRGQAGVLGFENVFFFIAALFLLVILTCLFLEKAKPGGEQVDVHM